MECSGKGCTAGHHELPRTSSEHMSARESAKGGGRETVEAAPYRTWTTVYWVFKDFETQIIK